MAAGETELINENVPLPRRHAKDEHGHGGHDGRLVPLNMYNPAEGLVPGLRESQRRRWAMAIDLSSCTGCSACVVACQSENNTPVIGKDQVTKGREMYWINIDRYYGASSTTRMGARCTSSRGCVQCENARAKSSPGRRPFTRPTVSTTWPTTAALARGTAPTTARTRSGGSTSTFQDWDTDTIKLGRNPDVSVRSRGVMEKCTFCVQRIRGAEIVAERELARGIRKMPDPEKGETLIKDGEILTACQSACPSGAIVFGDINDPHAAVSKWKNESTNYGLLAELNTRPRLTHMAVVRNPNPAMPRECRYTCVRWCTINDQRHMEVPTTFERN